MKSVAEEYEALEVIGKGSYGIVRKLRSKSTGEILVRKEIEYTSMNTLERNQLISELRILRELNHPNIVKYYSHEHIPERKSIHIYMEYCDGGDLAQIITNFRSNKESVPEEFIWQVLVQTLFALHRCHYGIDAQKVDLFSGTTNDSEPDINSETVVIHRDIKPDNIFILNSGKTVKLGDFGLAKMITSQNDFAKTYVGTPYYMSPEVLMDQPYSPVCDIWSLGCVLFELCTLRPPFQAKTHLLLQSKIKEGSIPALPESYSSQLRSIIRSCITVDPELRPSCYELLEALLVRFLRKEMELKQISSNLSLFLDQLVTKNEELKRKESLLLTLEKKVLAQKEELELEYNNMRKNCSMQKKQLEEELIEEFEMRKKAMDQEAKEVRLGYQREFKLVVEQEVQKRLREIMSKQAYSNTHELIRKKSDPSTQSPNKAQYQPRGLTHQQMHFIPDSNLPTKPRGPKELTFEDNTFHYASPRRIPLKARNDQMEDYDIHNGIMENHTKVPASRFPGNSYKQRITDRLERLSIEKRHIPEFEELYLRGGRN